jgi:Uma2 family endonuclease
MAMALRERTFTVDEYHRMAQAGILGEDERVELIEGRIVEMNPIGPGHLWSVNRLTRMFARLDGVLVSVQNPIRLDQGSEPEPDLAVVRADAAQDHTPGPADVLLVIEVADSSLGYDRQVKASLYARAGVPELWIADLGGERVEAHRDPSAAGYRTVHLSLRGERISPLFAPELSIEVDEILGQPKREAQSR